MVISAMVAGNRPSPLFRSERRSVVCVVHFGQLQAEGEAGRAEDPG